MGETRREPGRELDLAVCEALGYSGRVTIYEWADRKRHERPRVVFRCAPGDEPYWGALCERSFRTFATDDGQRYVGEAYWPLPLSERIEWAWRVVEKMRERGFGVTVTDNQGGPWACEMWNPDVIERADTAPHAICLAALAALEGADTAVPPSEPTP